MIQTLISTGHRYQDVVEEYTLEEVHLFYASALKQAQESFKRDAIAARIAQADKKGFDSFMKGIESSVRKVEQASRPKAKPKAERSDEAFKRFFGDISKLPDRRTAQQASDKALKEKGSGEALDMDDIAAVARTTVPINPTGIRRLPRPAPPPT